MEPDPLQIDPRISLAVSMHAKPGGFALLLGSGVSRSAQIPTGWDIVLSLTRRVALLEGPDAEPDPAAWHRERFGAEPDYSELLERLGATPAQRSQLIRSFVEPTPEERSQGLKLPTDAHIAIAELVDGGYVRVIVTTNFDRLLETALFDVGITPDVIASADDVAGVLPLAHNRCTIIKLNGDYIDARIRNTRGELTKYEPALRRLLVQVLTEYGLVVCGWSADWDPALADAVERSISPWFGTYWSVPSSPREAAQHLIQRRGAYVIQGDRADEFFRLLADSVLALENMQRPERLIA